MSGVKKKKARKEGQGICAWLEQARLINFEPQLASIGITQVHDLARVSEGQLVSAGFNVIQCRRFLSLLPSAVKQPSGAGMEAPGTTAQKRSGDTAVDLLTDAPPSKRKKKAKHKERDQGKHRGFQGAAQGCQDRGECSEVVSERPEPPRRAAGREGSARQAERDKQFREEHQVEITCEAVPGLQLPSLAFDFYDTPFADIPQLKEAWVKARFCSPTPIQVAAGRSSSVDTISSP